MDVAPVYLRLRVVDVRASPGLRLHFVTLKIRHITHNWYPDHDVVGQALHFDQWDPRVKQCGGKQGEVEKAICKRYSPKVSGRPLRVNSG